MPGKLQGRPWKSTQTRKVLQKGPTGGETELDYDDLRVPPDADEAAVDDDILVVGVRSLAAQTSSPTGLDEDDATNTQETIDEVTEGKKSSGP